MNEKNYRQSVAEAVADEMLRNPHVSVKRDNVMSEDTAPIAGVEIVEAERIFVRIVVMATA